MKPEINYAKIGHIDETKNIAEAQPPSCASKARQIIYPRINYFVFGSQ